MTVRKVKNDEGRIELAVTLNIEWPEGFDYLREAFEFVSDQRETGEQGMPQRLKHTEIEAGLRQLGETFAPWEVRALTAMDAAYCNALCGEIAADMKRHAKKG